MFINYYMKKTFIKELLNRRIPQIIGSYIVASTSLVLFIEYLVDKYNFASHYPAIALFGVLAIIPSVIILAYFHGAPGKDEWTKIEKIGIPINILFMTCILFFGDNFGMWNISVPEEDKPIKYLIHISSLEESANIYENSKLFEPILGKNKKISVLENTFLDSIRENVRIHLLSEYYDSNKEVNVLTSNKDVQYLNNYNITIDNFGDDELVAIDSIYNKFDFPNRIFTIHLFSLTKLDEQPIQSTYFYNLVANNCLPSKSCWSDAVGIDFDNIESVLVEDLRTMISKQKRIGKVIKIKDDIISVKLANLKIQEDMIISAATVYDFMSNGAELGIIDSKDGINYYKDLNSNDNKQFIDRLEGRLESFQELSKIHKDSLPFISLSTTPFSYELKVIEVIDSIAITKRINIEKPFVKVRVGDKVVIN